MTDLSSHPQPDDKEKLRACLKRETKIELEKKRNGLVTAEDMISPSKKLMALGTLYSSLVSLTSQPLSNEG